MKNLKSITTKEQVIQSTNEQTVSTDVSKEMANKYAKINIISGQSFSFQSDGYYKGKLLARPQRKRNSYILLVGMGIIWSEQKAWRFP